MSYLTGSKRCTGHQLKLTLKVVVSQLVRFTGASLTLLHVTSLSAPCEFLFKCAVYKYTYLLTLKWVARRRIGTC